MSDATIYIVDDDPPVRDALLTLAESVGLRARGFANAQDFLDACNDGCAGCVVTDICMPGIDGMKLQEAMIEAGIDLPLIAMSAHGDIAMAVEMVRRGAIDFIEKPFRNHIMLQRIREALDRNMQSRARQSSLGDVRRRLESLTPREHEILSFLIDGKSNKLIARQLSLSPRTVETHRANILRKMRSGSVTALAQQMAQLPTDF